jgi:hypothetical protein
MPKFLLALIIAILAASLLTFISIEIYVSSGVSSIDLSRPGYDALRQRVKTDSIANTFSSTGPLDTQTLDSFKKTYSKQTTDLQATGTFSDSSLDDTAIGLSTETPTQ